MNFLVETKNEYTIQLINILSPHIYEGFESIYSESKKIIKKGEEKKVLKAFQQFIKRIPSWNTNLIENETIRIRTASRCDFLHNLLKAVIKANIILLSNGNNNSYNKSVIEKKYLDIPLHKFIHRCYVECARQFYNSPYLFYHDIRPIERKRNQRDCYDIIKNGIKEAIRKILPVQHILDKYLGDNLKLGNDEIDKPISAIESENLKQLISQDLNSGNSNIETKISNSNEDNNFLPSQLVDKMTEINTIKDNIPYEDSSDDETVNLLSEIKKNIVNINSEQPRFNETMIGGINQLSDSDKNSDNIASVPITNYYSENKNNINIELKKHEHEQMLRESDNVHQQIEVNESEQRRSEHKRSEHKRSEHKRSEKNKNLDSDSSIMYIGNDDDYEDVFSNINDTNLSDVNNKKSLDNKVINKKMRDAYFSRFNGL
jgi:hypothetical protein